MPLLLTLLVAFAMFGLLGSYIAGAKNRTAGEGFLLGFVFGPLGVLVAALLPTLAPPKKSAAAPKRVVRRAVSGWQPPREVVEEQDADAFRFLTEPGQN